MWFKFIKKNSILGDPLLSVNPSDGPAGMDRFFIFWQNYPQAI
jgi:hypothetical protein